MKAGTYLKSVGSARNSPVKPFHLKPVRKWMAKLKCSTSFSPYFLHFFFQFSPNFPHVKNSNCFHHRSTDVCRHTGKGQDFLLQWILPVPKIHESVAQRLRQPKKRLRLCGTQTHLFSVATKVYGAKCLSCSWPRKKCHGNPTGSPLVRRFLLLGQLETNGWPALRTLRCASWSYTRRGRKLIL